MIQFVGDYVVPRGQTNEFYGKRVYSNDDHKIHQLQFRLHLSISVICSCRSGTSDGHFAQEFPDYGTIQGSASNNNRCTQITVPTNMTKSIVPCSVNLSQHIFYPPKIQTKLSGCSFKVTDDYVPFPASFFQLITEKYALASLHNRFCYQGCFMT